MLGFFFLLSHGGGSKSQQKFTRELIGPGIYSQGHQNQRDDFLLLLLYPPLHLPLSTSSSEQGEVVLLAVVVLWYVKQDWIRAWMFP